MALGVTLGAARAVEPAPSADALAPLAWLAGSCWTGTFADGKKSDLVCYEWMLDGQFLRSRHRVRGGAEPYAGETIYRFDRASGKIEYAYYNSLGDLLPGDLTPDSDGISFPPRRMTIGGESAELRSAWKRRGPDAYSALTDRRTDGDWKTILVIEFVRTGPSSDWDRRE